MRKTIRDAVGEEAARRGGFTVGQTLLDVCEAEAKFVKHVRELQDAASVLGAAEVVVLDHPDWSGEDTTAVEQEFGG